ncbi:unnamed protein product [Parascedosporium putredinis]|uniref:Glyoxalase-like domain-containing protein n=1 Tax=Parascedosporium putredinis TaxID=1442378 RepID=A0A9P1M8D5_9PEZI|nr:unnamed protein product [Parascedosporium putredinis]CAI7992436.1 unnamed protein product [Parascedosporium putredinis]
MADKSTILPILDHIIILVSFNDLQALPQKLEDSLTVIDGGAHTDGLTVNKLVIFPDGVYLEFIAFRDDADPDGRKAHQWGSLEEGAIVDWAYTLRDENEFAGVQKRVREASDPAVGVWYKDPVPGGRTRPDGVELKWAVSFSRDAAGKPLWPGTAPFWCFDRTPRHNRVPYHDNETGAAPAYTKHASGAVGVSRVSVTVPEKEFLIISQAYEGYMAPLLTVTRNGSFGLG